MPNNSIILTGFQKYGKFSLNLSGEIVRSFDEKFQKYHIEKTILPVSWNRSVKSYSEFVNTSEFNPSLVILMGIHSENKFSLENNSYNCAFGKDMDGFYKFGFINIKGPLRLKTTLNIKEIYKSLRLSLKLSISYFPGFYLCNFIYYWALDISKNKYPVIFIHVPSKGDLEESMSIIKKILKHILNYTLK